MVDYISPLFFLRTEDEGTTILCKFRTTHYVTQCHIPQHLKLFLSNAWREGSVSASFPFFKASTFFERFHPDSTKNSSVRVILLLNSEGNISCKCNRTNRLSRNEINYSSNFWFWGFCTVQKLQSQESVFIPR
jgi:hypothetical protein